ncbi:flagellar motor protein MotB [Rubrivirga sp. IMCC45206]|uniref:flagellar motor protein MotB n=1 Tax=Rubrivirga sp. IMCC45206 TaxID=3391614 RepID=UPI00398FF21F
MDPALLEDEEPSAPFWMATFSDMMTLLLAFFVMLVAMSSVEVKKFEEALSYFTGRTGVMQEEGLAPGIIGIAAEKDTRADADAFEQISRRVEEEGLGAAVELALSERGIRVTFVDSIGFAPGSAALDGPATTVLAVVAAGATVARGVEVEGHTDNVPIASAVYPSNWELSAARAAAVVRFLAADSSALAPDRYAAVGFGEHRPRAPNDIPEGRARNRRISVLFRSTPGDDADFAPLFDARR